MKHIWKFGSDTGAFLSVKRLAVVLVLMCLAAVFSGCGKGETGESMTSGQTQEKAEKSSVLIGMRGLHSVSEISAAGTSVCCMICAAETGLNQTGRSFGI